MSIYAISDLHLSFGADKPMDIFKGWNNYTERIKANWKRLIGENDTVILPGDFSWGLKLEETKKDFEFLELLPGKKLLIKGNHDLWWSTAKKLREFFSAYGFSSVDIERCEKILKEDLPSCFREFQPYIDRCKFQTNCSHITDKGCAVVEAVKNGEISAQRHQSYIDMYNEVKDIKEWQLK